MVQGAVGIPCKNCDKVMGADDGKIFAEVVVCPTCYTMAERLFSRCDRELRQMLLLLQEAIRVALIEGKLHYGAAQPLDEVPKEELLRMIVKMTESKHARAAARSSVL